MLQTNAPTKQTGCEIDAATYAYVRKRARSLLGKYGITKTDLEDIEQELFLRIVPHLQTADPQPPRWRNYVKRIVNSRLASLVRSWRAAKRKQPKTLFAYARDANDNEQEEYEQAEAAQRTTEGGDPPLDTLKEQAAYARLGIARRSDAELTELRLDVAAVMAGLPDDLRELCERLKHETVAQIAQSSNVSHDAVDSAQIAQSSNVSRDAVESAIRRLRECFEKAGLREYLQ